MVVIGLLDGREYAVCFANRGERALACAAARERAIHIGLLRNPEGLRPYAAVKSLGPSALADGGYPPSRDFQRTPEVAPLSAHDEVENISADATSETVKDLALGMNVERRVSFGMERAKTDILLTRSPQMTVLASDTEKLAALFYAFCVQVDGHAPVTRERWSFCGSVVGLGQQSRSVSDLLVRSRPGQPRPSTLGESPAIYASSP